MASMTDFRETLEGDALNAVLQERLRQLALKGHSRKSDNARPVTWLLGQAFKQLFAAKRYAPAGEQHSLTAARHWAVRAAATCLALIDCIDHENLELRKQVSREDNERARAVSREQESKAA
jgi:hypothetical protein